MGDKNPNSLGPIKTVNAVRMNRWPLYAVLLIGLFLLGVLIYSVNFAHNQEQELPDTPKADIGKERQLLLMGEGRGLALSPPVDSPAIVSPEPDSEEVSKREPLIVVRDRPKQSDQYRRELENLRRMKAQAQLSALSAPLGVKRTEETGRPENIGVTIGNTDQAERATGISGDPYGIRESAYDTAADKDKEAFFDRAEKDSHWILPYSRVAGQPLELKTGTVIPGLMITGINSDLPGNIIAQVSRNVFDTATGRRLLIPHGAKLFGVYDSRVVFGQKRVLVAWNRIVFPDGSAVTLGAMPGADVAGYAGYMDEVDNHYLRIFGSALLMSVITGGMSYSMDALNNNNDESGSTPSLQDEMGSALASQLGQSTLQLLQKNVNIKPTLEIRPGYQFNVIVTKDIVFQKPYIARK